MIKVGIYGAKTPGSPVLKQLLRLLLRHPDVDLRVVASPGGTGERLASIYPVYTGETELCLERRLDIEGLDILFVIDESNLPAGVAESVGAGADLRVVVLGEAPAMRASVPQGFVYGFAEYNRKALVRGATAAVSPSPTALLVETALFPLAKQWRLKGDVHGILKAPCDGTSDGTEALGALRAIMPDYQGTLTLKYAGEVPYERMDLELTLPLDMPVEDVVALYNDAYEDHNFVYLIDGAGGIDEDMRGSNKCLLQIYSDGKHLKINATADMMTRGNAGNAVHLMNLLFGLHERTGLSI